MGNVDRCIKTLPTNEMMFHVRRDATLRARWLTDLEGVAREFGLSGEELDALRDKDVRRLQRATSRLFIYSPQRGKSFISAPPAHCRSLRC